MKCTACCSYLRCVTVSIIVPAYNEADSIAGLLSDIRNQTSVKPEVIVADAQSTDGTRDIARSFDVAVVEGGRPARGRNEGARIATGELLVFLDADVRIAPDFLQSVTREVIERDLVAATAPSRPLSPYGTDRAIHNFANAYIRLTQYNNPHAPGYCIIVRRDTFVSMGGFDERLQLAEDHELVKRAGDFGKFRMLRNCTVQVDVRRLKKEGRLGYALKTIRVVLYRVLQGEIEEGSDEFEYEFGDFSEDEADTTRAKVLQDIEKALLKLDERTGQAEDKLYHRVQDTMDRSASPGAGTRSFEHTLKQGWKAIFSDESDKD